VSGARRLVLALDQSTQGTKALLFDQEGKVVSSTSLPHRQYVNDQGWVEHDPEEILANVCSCVRTAVADAHASESEIVAFGISNQRETCVAWDRMTRKPLCRAIVWQCGRAAALCEELKRTHPDAEELVQERSGLALSPYFSAAKMSWMLQNIPAVQKAAEAGTLCFGTIDSWLAFSLCEGHPFVTEPSNASRTQLLNLKSATWDPELLNLFGIDASFLPEVLPSDARFGASTFDGRFEKAIPLTGILGDSQAALAAQDCFEAGSVKATYGTGSSVMMQIGAEPKASTHGLVTSIAWNIDGKTSYVLEGNLNYTGAVISWLKDNVGLISDPSEVEPLIARANPRDRAYFVPAFTGLGAPWWDTEATGMLTGITRTTGKAEIVKACAECIPYQIADVLDALRADSGLDLKVLQADGGVTKNFYLMQFQADIAGAAVHVSQLRELSAAGAAFVAGHAAGLYPTNLIHEATGRTVFEPKMAEALRQEKRDGWQDALAQVHAHA